MANFAGRQDKTGVRTRRAIPPLNPGILALFFPLLLGACSLPPALQIASWVTNAFSYLTTSKSVSDHGISMVSGRDCALHRGLAGDDVCRGADADSEAMVASLDSVNDASRDSWEAVVEIAGVTEQKAGNAAPSTDVDVAAEPMEANSVSPAPMPTPAPHKRDEPVAMLASLDLAPATREPISAGPGSAAGELLEVNYIGDPDRERNRQIANRATARRTTRDAGKVDLPSRAPEVRRGVYYSLASFALLANAEKLIRRNAGLSPSLMTAQVNGKNVYRVVVGPITGSQGKELRHEIASAGFRDAWALWASPPQIEGEAG